MRRTLIFFFLISLFFFPFILSSAQKLNKNLAEPKIKLNENFWDFGHIPSCAKVSQVFKIQNQGNDTLIITRVRSDCGCTHTPLSKSKIAPGETAELELIFDPSKFRGQIQKAVSIMSNDVATPISDIVFTAMVGLKNTMAKLSPEEIFFDTLTSNQEKTGEIEVKNISKAELFITAVQGPQEFIDYRIEKFELIPGESTQIFFRTRPPLASGLFRTSLTLELSGSEKIRCTIPIQGFVSK